MYVIYGIGTLAGSLVIIKNYEVFGKIISIAFIALAVLGFICIYIESKLSDVQMSMRNVIKTIETILNADNVETKLLMVAFGVAILVIISVCILRLPSFILGEKINELL